MINYCLFKRHELEYIREDTRANLEDFWCWYMVDLRPVYVASLTPSYAAQEIKGECVVKEGCEIDEDVLFELESTQHEWTYFDCKMIDRYLAEHPEMERKFEDDDDWESCLEYHTCNAI